MKFPDIRVSRDIGTSCEKLWELITDTSRWNEWGPSVSSVECPDRFIHRGSHGRIQTAAGLWVPFLITDFEDGSYWLWHVSGVRATGHRVERTGIDSCRLVFEVPFFAAAYSSVCRIALRRIAGILEEQAPGISEKKKKT